MFRPWIPKPAMWMQRDWGEGPRTASRRTSLWCAWPAWSRFRVVIPVFDKLDKLDNGKIHLRRPKTEASRAWISLSPES